MEFIDLGVVPFQEGLKIQETAVAHISSGHWSERVYLLEHEHVFTLGRRGDVGNLLWEKGPDGQPVQTVRINRGGDITYHGPGQLVGYPHLDLQKRNYDLHRYLRDLELCLIHTVGQFGIEASRREGLTGVWTPSGKLASIGIGVRRWVTMHGFALNVNADLRYFQMINPCGLPGCAVTSMSKLLNRPVDIGEVRKAFCDEFEKVFAIETWSAGSVQ
ncbi:MAG TPA: lipoyl(octanoyl) transferase LipB [Acidobacteriota bacterium]|nr:lipoyl(octanoyl) transferase LipB [Acidobacteriota bacterium]